MSTPSRPTFTDVLDILTGRSPPPVSRFLSYSGQLSPQQIQSLADAIRNSSVQGGFRLKGCLLGDSGAEILASALASNQVIHTLELVGNGIGRPGAEALAACLTENTTLTSLDLADNPCEWDAADVLEAIDNVLHRNRMLASRNSGSLESSPTEPRNPSASPRDQSRCPQSESPGSEHQPLAPPNQAQTHPLGSLNQSPSRPSIAPASHRPVPPLSLSGLGRSKSARDVVLPSGKENRAGTARTSATSRTSPGRADNFEHRLLYLETASDNVSREIARMRGDLTQVNEWEQRVDTLSNEVAAVFASVQTEQTTFRTWFDDLASWQQRSETECQRFSGELASFGGDLHSLYQHVMHTGLHVEDKAGSMAYNQAQEVWDKCNVELEELHSRIHDVWQAHDQLVSITGADDGVTGQDLDSRLQALEHDMQQVHVKTEELDRHINKMLTKMIEFANQEQLRLKYDYNELKGRVAEAEQKVQDNLSGQHQDRAALKTLQSQVAKLEFGEQRLQQQTAGMAEALEDMIRRKSPSVLWQMSQEAAVQDAADRLVRLEQGLVDANSYAETEAVRSAQTEAVLDGLLHFKTHTEAKLVAAQASLDHLLSAPPVSNFLSFSGPLDIQQIHGLSTSLKTSSVSGGLRLKGCTLNDSGAELIAEALVDNQTLNTLELPDNDIGCRGADALAEVLHSKNFTLTTLELTGNPCEALAPHAIELITTCLRRNRLGLNNASPNTPTKSMGGFATPPTAYHTVQPFGFANSPESKDGGSAKRVLQTSGKENWVVSTSRGNDGGALGSVGMGAIELEYRLQHLESSQDAISSEVDHIKALGSNIEGWKHQMNDAGAQAAAVLALVQSDGSEIRARLSDLDNWRVNVEAASQHFDSLVGGLRSKWFHLEQRYDQISNRIEHRGRTPRAIDCSPYQQQVQQVREQCQQQLELLHANVEEVQQAQQALAATSGVGRGADADLDVHARLEALGQDLDDVRGVTHRLERYVEQMLRQMLGSLNAGQQRLKGKLQQEVTDLGQVVEQMKGRKGAALPWQRAQEQAVQKLQEKKDLQRAAGKAAVRLGGQKPAGVRRSLVAGDRSVPEQLHRQPLSEVPLGELSGSQMASPGRSVTPLLGSMSAEGLQELLAASLTLTPPPSNPDAQDVHQGSQSNEALQQQVVQQQADITRLESQLATLQSQFGVTHQQDRGHLIAPVETASPTDSPSISRSPSPPLQRTSSQPATKLQVGTAASIGSTRVTGSKRTLSSRSNQDSARQLGSKRVGRSSTAARSSIGVGRSFLGGGIKGRTSDVAGRSGVAAESGSVEASPARLHHTAPVVQTHKQGAGAENSPASDIKRGQVLRKSKEGSLRRGGEQE
ncbi:hypothetical protein WJX82_006404 [Trebouxia sp. C0006]